jgi:DNA-binding transcriptional regulator YhcF (GntR family)
MINPEIIRKNYSTLSDQQLIDFAKTDGQKITDVALEVLHDELANRGLDTSILKTITERKTLDIKTSNWDYAF